MTTIGSTNPYYASLYTRPTKSAGNTTADDNGDFTEPKRSQTSTGLTGSDSVFGSKLSSALWSMESQGVEVSSDQGDTWLGDKPSTAVEDEFASLSTKTLAERIRDQYLKEHDLTESDVSAMSPDDRAAVEADIRKAILEAMGVNGKQQQTAMNMGAGPNPAAATSATATGKDAKNDPLVSM